MDIFAEKSCNIPSKSLTILPNAFHYLDFTFNVVFYLMCLMSLVLKKFHYKTLTYIHSQKTLLKLTISIYLKILSQFINIFFLLVEN